MATAARNPDPSTTTIFDDRDLASVRGRVDSDGSLLSGTLGWGLTHRGARPFARFITEHDDGLIPTVSFVDGIGAAEGQHPTANVQLGEAWMRNIYELARSTPRSSDIAIVSTHDEAGGLFERVPPPDGAHVARPDRAICTKFTELGCCTTGARRSRQSNSR